MRGGQNAETGIALASREVRVALIGINLPSRSTRSIRLARSAFEIGRFGGIEQSRTGGWHIPCAKAKGLFLFAHGYGARKASLLPEAKPIHRTGLRRLSASTFTAAEARGGARRRLECSKPTMSRAAVEYVRRKFPHRV